MQKEPRQSAWQAQQGPASEQYEDGWIRLHLCAKQQKREDRMDCGGTCSRTLLQSAVGGMMHFGINELFACIFVVIVWAIIYVVWLGRKEDDEGQGGSG